MIFFRKITCGVYYFELIIIKKKYDSKYSIFIALQIMIYTYLNKTFAYQI